MFYGRTDRISKQDRREFFAARGHHGHSEVQDLRVETLTWKHRVFNRTGTEGVTSYHYSSTVRT